ncbi:GRAM domain-containing protein 2A-like isoform X1 [Takifugu flavidus]|uniref:GRAM domain-containing protein 2A-like isoform X1 n=1 Tax=Takifugu flavidus TaxID=433684 RepID=UPI002544346A|nr:GRAM domain-containing protein 2A-like isoform X1 [Takifugu flavidus]
MGVITWCSIMSLKGRKFSLDNSVCCSLDRLTDSSLGGRRGSGRTGGNKSRNSMDESQMEIHSLNSSMSLSKEIIAEDSLEHSEGLLKKNSLQKNNKTFHKLFPEVPEDETVTHACSCSLNREVLYHGRLFVSENYLCFHSSVLLKDTKVVIPMSSVRQVKKHYLSMVSVQTADGEKYTFVSLRQREFTFELIQTRCLNMQGESTNSSPHVSSAENEPDQMASGCSSLEDSFDHDVSRQSSVHLEEDFPRASEEGEKTGPPRQSSDAQSSLTDADGAPSWIWGLIGRLSPFPLDLQDTSLFFYFNMLLVALLLLVSGFIGLRIMALQEQLESLGALAELHLHHKEYQET